MLGNAARTETEAANALPPEGRTMQDVLNVKCSRRVASVKCQANVRQANTLRVVATLAMQPFSPGCGTFVKPKELRKAEKVNKLYVHIVCWREEGERIRKGN